MNPVQALMIISMTDQWIAVKDLTINSYYLGTNATYNLKNLYKHGYIHRQPCPEDRRSILIALSPKGLAIQAALQHVFNTTDTFAESLITNLQKLEHHLRK
jgi:DNA-binding MarR family transcriptional regulator